MGGIVFGNDEKAARVLVNAVDDARADGPADARQLPRAVVKQRVDERAVRVAGAGCTTMPLGLLTTSRSSSSYTMSSGMFWGRASMGCGSGRSMA